MKKLYTLLAIIATIATFAQAPQGFNYQATVRNSTGALIVNQIVLVKFNVYQNNATGTLVYSENQTANTDDLGHINLVVGQGTAITGTFTAINWGTGSYYLGIELNTGSGYVAMGTTQLLSVPYALYANSSGNGTTMGAISNTPNPKGATIASGILSLTPADAANGGILTTGNQTISGEKIFNSDMKINGITLGKGAGQLSSNTVVGSSSLTANTTGNGNIAIGNTALGNNITGNNNIAIGNASSRSNYNGNNNTIVGHSADVLADNLTNATAFGFNAKVATSNTIQLGDNNLTDVKTAGKVTATGFKTTNGTANQYLMADGSVSNTGGTSLTLLGKIIYCKYVNNLGVIWEIWKVNYDGSNNSRINIQVPPGILLLGNENFTYRPKMSPDGLNLFFTALNNNNQMWGLYSCSFDGSNFTTLYEGSNLIDLSDVK
jgi:hypothetical protein